jgi:hypothetical protein
MPKEPVANPKSRVESALIPYVTYRLVTTTILITGAIFLLFFLSVCARVEVTTH